MEHSLEITFICLTVEYVLMYNMYVEFTVYTQPTYWSIAFIPVTQY